MPESNDRLRKMKWSVEEQEQEQEDDKDNTNHRGMIEDQRSLKEMDADEKKTQKRKESISVNDQPRIHEESEPKAALVSNDQMILEIPTVNQRSRTQSQLSCKGSDNLRRLLVLFLNEGNIPLRSIMGKLKINLAEVRKLMKQLESFGALEAKGSKRLINQEICKLLLENHTGNIGKHKVDIEIADTVFQSTGVHSPNRKSSTSIFSTNHDAEEICRKLKKTEISKKTNESETTQEVSSISVWTL